MSHNHSGLQGLLYIFPGFYTMYKFKKEIELKEL